MRALSVIVPVDGSAGSEHSEIVISGRIVGAFLRYTNQPPSCRVTITEDLTGAAIYEVGGNVDDMHIPPAYPANDRVRVAVEHGAPGQVEAQIRWE